MDPESTQPGGHANPARVRTVVFEPAENRTVVWLDAPIWPPDGSVIELPDPHPRDAVVIGTRLILDPPTSSGERMALVTIDIKYADGLVERAGFTR